MRYCVTGGAGFIGSHLVEELLSAGHAVTVLDDLSTGRRAFVPPSVEFIEGSILDLPVLTRAMKGCDGVFHLAAIASVARSLEEWGFTHDVNQSGSVYVFEQAAKSGIPVVYASSAATYGANVNLPLAESETMDPLSPYGLDKLACEWQARIGHKALRLKSAGMRFFNVYGPRQDPKSPYSGVISIFMQHLQDQKALTIFGDGLQSRDFIYVGDVIRHLMAGMDQLHKGSFECEVFNVCTGMETTVLDMAGILKTCAGSDAKIEHKQARDGDIRHSRGNPEKAKRLLHVEAQTPFKQGIQHTWYAFQQS
jgi:UDP-glucose 4-epimerase